MYKANPLITPSKLHQELQQYDFREQTWEWGKVKKEENDVGVWGPQ